MDAGDQILVRTRNSLYQLWAAGDGTYVVRGGWFDRQGLAPAVVAVAGCTFGGCAICTEIVAAPGLHLEFGNRVVTTRIRSVRWIRRRASA